MPLRTVQRRLAGNRDIGVILVSVRDGESDGEGARSRSSACCASAAPHRRPKEDDFHVMDMKEISHHAHRHDQRADRAARAPSPR